MRDRLFEDCANAGDRERGVYTLTAPTGLGKTLTLMAFALRHCLAHPEMKRVILLLPYLAIAKQNVDDYRRVFPDLLESHSAAVLTEQTKRLAERWSAECIVTTNVGFFEPLFASGAPNLRRLHQIANSVIILDEAQSLPPHLLDATLKTVRLLFEKYGCTFVFSTATQPSFQYRPGLCGKEGARWQSTEIVPNPQQLFKATRRVRVDWRLDTPLSLSAIAAEMTANRAGCCILNLRKHAQKLYDELCLLCPEEEVFLLSADQCQAHRERLIKTVKERLRAGLPVYLAATQCIEAGVDLDFPAVYRALAPLEAVIQAAGRCNRNAAQKEGLITVFLPDEKTRYPKGEFYENAANCLITISRRHPIDISDLAHIEEYYKLLYEQSPGDHRELTEAIGNKDYAETEKAYRMIDNHGVQVIVPDPESMELFKQVRDLYDRDGLTREVMKLARPITVSSYDTESVRACCVALTVRSPFGAEEEKQAGWYLLGGSAFYSPKKGLTFTEENNMTNFMI